MVRRLLTFGPRRDTEHLYDCSGTSLSTDGNSEMNSFETHHSDNPETKSILRRVRVCSNSPCPSRPHHSMTMTIAFRIHESASFCDPPGLVVQSARRIGSIRPDRRSIRTDRAGWPAGWTHLTIRTVGGRGPAVPANFWNSYSSSAITKSLIRTPHTWSAAITSEG